MDRKRITELLIAAGSDIQPGERVLEIIREEYEECSRDGCSRECPYYSECY